MRAEEVVWLLDCQRHDYLNHLQVISGLLELGKPGRAAEYLKEALRTIEIERTLLKRQDLELGLFLYRLWQKLRAFQIEARFVQIQEVSEDGVTPADAVDHLDSIVEEIATAFSGKLIEVSVLATPGFISLLAGDNVEQLRLTHPSHVINCHE